MCQPSDGHWSPKTDESALLTFVTGRREHAASDAERRACERRIFELMAGGVECVRVDERDHAAEVACLFELGQDRIGAGFLVAARLEELFRQNAAQCVGFGLRIFISPLLVLKKLRAWKSIARQRNEREMAADPTAKKTYLSIPRTGSG